MRMHLETERLTLRPWAVSDAEDYSALVGERERRVEGDFIEYCGLIIGRAAVEEPEIAYELFRRARGHGCATEAARAVLDAAIATGRSRLWSTVRAWNAPSLRVLDKLDFHPDHVDPDDGKGEVVWLTRPLP